MASLSPMGVDRSREVADKKNPHERTFLARKGRETAAKGAIPATQLPNLDKMCPVSLAGGVIATKEIHLGTEQDVERIRFTARTRRGHSTLAALKSKFG